MTAAIREAGLTGSILDTLSPDAIREHLAGLTAKVEKAAAKRYTEAEKLKATAEAALAASAGTAIVGDFFDSQLKDYHKIVQELLSNGIADYHFVERTEPDENCQGYVALLREIRYLPVALAGELREGIDLERFSALCRDNTRYADKLIISNRDHYAMPVGLMQSPFIELFMQRFTQLYARIGVTDYSQDLIKSLRAIVPFNLGSTQ